MNREVKKKPQKIDSHSLWMKKELKKEIIKFIMFLMMILNTQRIIRKEEMIIRLGSSNII